ncbi:MAG: hypothetical protein ACPGGG_08550 [Parvibaculales bacterium]
MAFVWNKFGVLDDRDEDERYFYIFNENGDWRKISKEKYADSMPDIREKVEQLLAAKKPILFRTSQNTGDWSTGEWFSDVSLDEENWNSPELAIPFSEPQFFEGEEPDTVGSVEELAETLKQKDEMIKKLSDDKEDLKAQNTELQNQLAQADLREGENNLDKRGKYEIWAGILERRKILNTSHKCQIKGHPARELALRLGHVLPSGKRNIVVKFTEHVKSNEYRGELEEFCGDKAVFRLGVENDGEHDRIFISSIRNMMGNGWFRKFKKVIGESEASYKDRADLTREELADIHRKVMSEGETSEDEMSEDETSDKDLNQPLVKLPKILPPPRQY